MEAPLPQEAATADLISDIIAPTLDQSSDVSDLAHDLTSGAICWRQAWSLRMHDADETEREGAPRRHVITRGEDDESRMTH